MAKLSQLLVLNYWLYDLPLYGNRTSRCICFGGDRMTAFKPMLAGKLDPAKLQFPVIIQPKLDGIRATVVGGKLLTRTLKEVPNRHIFNLLSKSEYEGLDGELIVGSPVADDCYRTTVSGVMSSDGEPDFTYNVFDLW